MLRDLTINHYRLFKQFELSPIARVNLIVGTNNSGKSSLLEAIYLLTSSDVGSSLIYILNERGEFVSRPVDPRFEIQRMEGYQISQIFYGRLLEPGQTLSIRSRTEKETSLNILLQEVRSSVNSNVTQLPLIGETFEEEIEATNGRVQSLVFEHTKPGSGPLKEAMRITEDGLLPYRVYGRRIASPGSTSRLVTTNYLVYDELAALWDKITLTPKEDKVVEALQILEPKVDRISFTSSRISNSGILLKLRGENEPIPLGSMGDGMRRILAIIASLVGVEKGTLLVDEIDTGLYYGVLTDMWRLLLETSSKQKAQVFATTHSWDCVKAFQQALNDSGDHDLGCLVRLEKLDNQIKAVSYSADELDIAIKQNIEVR